MKTLIVDNEVAAEVNRIINSRRVSFARTLKDGDDSVLFRTGEGFWLFSHPSFVFFDNTDDAIFTEWVKKHRPEFFL